eukprot:12933690-Alexandrium_andersonii.AAC.1
MGPSCRSASQAPMLLQAQGHRRAMTLVLLQAGLSSPSCALGHTDVALPSQPMPPPPADALDLSI